MKGNKHKCKPHTQEPQGIEEEEKGIQSNGQSKAIPAKPKENTEENFLNISIVLDMQEDRLEIIRNFKAKKSCKDELHFKYLINELKKYGYPIENATVFYHNCNIWVKCDMLRDELNNIPITAINKEKRIKEETHVEEGGIKDSKKAEENKGRLNLRIVQNSEGLLQDYREDKKKGEKDKKRRTKERTISFVVDKVLQWRNLYKGIGLDGHHVTHISLDEAAKKVGISKKSLDDYLLQLRAANKCHFDFNQYKDKKIGFLRSYVKNKKHNDEELLGMPESNEEVKML